MIKIEQGIDIRLRIELKIDIEMGEHKIKVAQGFMKLILARNAFGHVELASNLSSRLE